MLQDRLGLSERRACRYVGQPRSTQRREPSSRRMTRRSGRSCVRSPASGRGGGTARRISICSSRAGASIASGCSGCGARKGCACRRSAANASGAGNRPCRAIGCGRERPDHVWAFDFQFDVTDDGRAVKLLYVVDEFTREALAMEAERRIDGDKVVDVLDRIVAERGTPPGVRALRQRAGDDLQRAAGLVPVHPDRRGVHRARQPVGEPVRRELQQPRPRRAGRTERSGRDPPSLLQKTGREVVRIEPERADPTASTTLPDYPDGPVPAADVSNGCLARYAGNHNPQVGVRALSPLILSSGLRIVSQYAAAGSVV